MALKIQGLLALRPWAIQGHLRSLRASTLNSMASKVLNCPCRPLAFGEAESPLRATAGPYKGPLCLDKGPHRKRQKRPYRALYKSDSLNLKTRSHTNKTKKTNINHKNPLLDYKYNKIKKLDQKAKHKNKKTLRKNRNRKQKMQ